MKIDFHCHFYPPRYFEMLRESGYEEEDIVRVSPPVWDSNDKAISIMEDHGIDRQVLSLSAPNVYFPDNQLSLALAQMTNDWMVDICTKDPDRFLGLASVPLGDVKMAIDELHRVRGRSGVVGIALGTNIVGKPLDAPEFQPFFEEVNRLGLLVFIHPMPPSQVANIEGYSLMSIVPFPFETTLCAARLAYSGTLERFPNMKIILSHLGGALPYLMGRIDYGYDKYEKPRGIIAKPPSEYFTKMYYDTALTYTTAQLVCAHDSVGADRILLGTDLPFAVGRVKPSLAVLEAANLPVESKEKMYWRNGKALLGLLDQGVSANYSH